MRLPTRISDFIAHLNSDFIVLFYVLLFYISMRHN